MTWVKRMGITVACGMCAYFIAAVLAHFIFGRKLSWEDLEFWLVFTLILAGLHEIFAGYKY